MNARNFFTFTFAVLLAGLLLFTDGAVAAESGASLIGSQTTNFSLSSDQGRLVSYGQDYYGKHHLIITFFPAAFTPV
jgi:hypothetical protein